MTLEGVVRNGVIVLDDGVPLAEGTKVQVIVTEKPSAKFPDGGETKPERPMSDLAKMLLKHAGTLIDLPEDAADQHDHYLYGTPKR